MTVQAHHALEAFLERPNTSTEDSPVRVAISGAQTFINVRSPSGGDGLPATANTFLSGESNIYWLGPDEWLCVGSEEDARAAAGEGATFADVSDGYVQLMITGSAAADVIAKGCTLDLHPDVFTQGQCAQTSIARADVLIARPGGEAGFCLIVRRSFAEYLALWLRAAGKHEGIGFHPSA